MAYLKWLAFDTSISGRGVDAEKVTSCTCLGTYPDSLNGPQNVWIGYESLFNVNFIKSDFLQTNRMTSWIDASFVYSTNEAWVNAMRTFVGGSLKMEGDSIFGMPSRNVERVPLANHPAPHVLRMLDPERMYCKYWNTNLPISPLLVINECNSSQNCKLISKK